MSGRIQNEDIKTQAELTGAGGAKSQLPNSAKVYLESYAELKTLKEALDERLLHGAPLDMHQAFPADAKLYLEASQINTIEGKAKTIPPIKNQIPVIVATTINFQTGATTGGTVDMTLPSTTVGQFRRVGLSLLSSGTIKVLFTAAAASVGALANAGTVFVKGALPLGYLDLEATASTAFKTAGSATSVIENKVSGTFRIFSFGSGGGSGSSSGTNSFLTDSVSRLNDSYFNRLSYNIFDLDDQTKTDLASTAVYDVANSQYDFSTIGFILKSLEMFTAGFFANTSTVDQVELIEDWGVADAAATREVSVDGGLNWNAVTMTQIDATNRYRGIVTLADPVTTATLWQNDVSNADSTEAFNASTEVSQGIQFDSAVGSGAKKKSTKVTVYLNKLGSPTGIITARIVKDSAGQPSTSVSDIIAYSAPKIVATDLSAGDNTVVITFSAVLPAGTYWLVLDTDATYQASYSAGVNEVRWRGDNSAPAYAGAYSKFNGTTWSAIATKKAVFKVEGVSYSLLTRITGAGTTGTLNGFSVFFESSSLLNPISVSKVYETIFSGDIDQTTFALTFLPDPKRLLCLELSGERAGRAYAYPFFTLSGQNVTFPSGTFLDPGVTKQLRFIDIGGSGFDNSDSNRSLMAANHLGSTDGGIDQSVNGRGIILRRPDGTLREIALDNSDQITITSVP